MPDKNAMTALTTIVEKLKPEFTALSDAIWGLAELKFHEHRSAGLQMEKLEKHGFRVARNAANIETAFVGERGRAGPVIAFLGEFDALSNLSQEAGIAEQKPLVGGGTGHGCGHNLLGAGSLLAATALAQYLETNNLPGTIRYYGCPGEEGGAGKTFMVRAGIFNDVDAALTWHPAPFNGARSTNNLAILSVYYRFKGAASHAGYAPHLGRSALDALELMNIGVNFLREHVPQECRMHYAITDTGGTSPNVVQANAEAVYLVRAPELPMVLDLAERIHKIARGAAMMTETEVEIIVDRATSNLLPNLALESRLHENMVALGPVPFDAADIAFARKIQETLSPQAIASSLKSYQFSKDVFSNGKLDGSTGMHLGLRDFEGASHFRSSSTDVGDVSWVTPTAQCWAPAWAIGTAGHTWQVVAQGKSPAAHKALAHAAKSLATTALDLILEPALLAQVKAEWFEKTDGQPYRCPIPDHILPRI